MYGGYKLNELAITNLRKADYNTASEWLQKGNLLTEKVDEDFHSALRLSTVFRNGDNLGDIYTEEARRTINEAKNALNKYHYYTNRANSYRYSTKDKLYELGNLLKT